MYRVIYDCINEIEAAMKGMLAPKFQEQIIGHVEIRQTFKVSKVGTVCGGYVTDGKIVRNSKVRVVRDNIVVFEPTSRPCAASRTTSRKLPPATSAACRSISTTTSRSAT